MKPPKKFYRYEYRYTSLWTDFVLYEFDFLKETPKGYWITRKDNCLLQPIKKWISKTSRKRYAYPTKKEAMENLFYRNCRYIEILNIRLKEAYAAFDKIKKEMEG